jgi:hypothetical protein
VTAVALCTGEVDDGVDPLGSDAEGDREVHVTIAVSVDEGVDSAGGE